MTRKPNGCVDCSLHKSGQGFVQITIPPDTSRIRLLLEGDTPNKDEADEGKSGVGKASHWLKKNVLANAGISENEILIDTALRCLPPRNKKGEHYPIGKDKLAAETHCRQYDKWNEIPKRIPLLLLGGKALALRLGHDNISDYHGHITTLDGRLVGATYHPAAVMRQPNLLPVAIREASNLLEAAANPSCLARPGVTKGFVPFLQCEEFVADLEWHPGTQELTAVGVAYSAKLGYSTYEVEPSLQVIRHLMEDGRRIVGHNIIDADIPKIGALPQSWSEKHVIDTKIVAHLVHAHLAELGLLGLGDLTRFYFPTSDWKQDKADLLTYNGWDCAYNFKLWQAIKRDIDATEQWHLVEKQQTLARMTSLMQREGIRLDKPALLEYARSRKEQKATAAATFPFNPNAPKQIAKWLSDEHKITVSDATFDTLAKLRGRHADIDRLIDYRDDNKSLTTWFPLEVDEKSKEVIDCGEWSFPHFNVTGTAVARFSCANPNFQNIPPHLRRFIVARDPSLEIVSFDAKNLENRTVAFQAGDTTALDAFAKGLDEYQLTAAMMLNKRYDDVTEDERKRTKVTELATMYCETHWNLAKRLYGNSKKESLAEAKRTQDAYYAVHPALKVWQKAVGARLDTGDIMLSNPFGRKRFIYAQDSHERMKRGCHFYGCSTGADFISERMILIWRELGLLPILQVHDELAYELDRGAEGLKLRAQIRDIFHRPVSQLNGMVLPVEAKVGTNYGKFSEDNPDGLRKVKL